MKGMTAFTCISEIDLDLIEESMSLFTSPKAVRGTVAREPSRLSRFLSSGWGVAMICAVVSLAVLTAIVWAGQQNPVTPPIHGTVESDIQTEPENETFSESGGGMGTSSETDTQPEPETAGVFHPDVTEGGVLFVSNGDGTCKIKGSDKIWQGSITVPEKSPYGDTVTTVATGAFRSFRFLTSVTLPDTVTVIGDSAFQGCGSLVSVELPPAVTEFGRVMFDGCGKLQSVVLPEGLTEIPSMTFQTCVSLESVVAREGVTSIETNAFNGCSGLQTLTLPAGLESVGSAAFKNCCGLQTVYFGGTREEWEAVEIHEYDNGNFVWVDVVFTQN